MLIPAYLFLIWLGFGGSRFLRGCRRTWESMLDQAEPSGWISRLKKTDPYLFYQWFLILFLVLMTIRAEGVPDFYNYQMAYSRMELGIPYMYLGRGWYWLMHFGITFGMTYGQMKGIAALVSLVLISSTINLFVSSRKSRVLVWSLFLIFPALLELTQIRFFLASSICIYGFRFLKKASWKNAGLYVLAVLAAAMFHSSALIYLAGLLTWLFRRFPKTVSCLCVLGSLVLFLGSRQLIALASRFIRSDRLERYFLSGQGMGKGGLAVCLLLCMFLIWITWKILSALKSKKGQHIRHPLSKGRGMAAFRSAFLIEGWNFLGLIILPLSQLDANFFRLQRPAWLLSYIACGIALSKGIRSVPVFGRQVSLRLLYFAAALLANLYFISIYTFQINTGYLM